MAQFKMTRLPSTTRTQKFRAEFQRNQHNDLPKHPLLVSLDLLNPKVGTRNYEPMGTEFVRDAGPHR